jgi:hypothetical protein
MHRILALIVVTGVLTAFGCSSRTGGSPGNMSVQGEQGPAVANQLDPAQLRGQTVREAVRRAGLQPEKCTIFDEPPGVARGVSGTTADQKVVHLWISRQDGIFREQRDWTFEQLAGRTVADVEIK